MATDTNTYERQRFGPVLVGMRGSGKSALAPRIAAELGMKAVDVDAELERQAGQTIASIFATEGEGGFRARERELLLSVVLLQEGTVVATGGGAVLHADVRQVLQQRFTIWVHAPIPILASRIASTDRPSLTGRPISEELEQVFHAREALYRQVAALELDSSQFSIDTLVGDSIRAWRSYCGQ